MTDEENEDDTFDEDYVPRVVILGAGPIGLEAALYGRYLGYEVAVFEKDKPCSNVARWGHVKMFSPFAMNRSSLGFAALKAQFVDHKWPDNDALLTGAEYFDSYLQPLAKSDLLRGCVHEGVEVVSVARDGILKTDQGLERSQYPLRVLVRSQDGDDTVDADFVIDATGVLDLPNALGHGGLPAKGELSAQSSIAWHVPDIAGQQKAAFEGKKTLVVGNGFSAATAIVLLANLREQAPGTEVVWLTRREASAAGPMPVNLNDTLPERQKLSELANQAVSQSKVQHFDQSGVLAIEQSEGRFRVTVGGKLSGDHEFDQVIGCTGFRPNVDTTRELQVDRCEVSEAPRGTAIWLSELGKIDAVELKSPGVEPWLTSEPNFFVIGSKSFGRNSNFLLSLGLEQIRDIYTQIAEREDLDLYATMQGLV